MSRKLKAYGKNVKKRLIDKDMTQVELAARLGCGKNYVNKIVSGERSGRKYWDEIARILDIDVPA